MGSKETRKSTEDVRNERKASKEAHAARAVKTAAYDVAYKAAALARREKLAAEAAAGTAAPVEAPKA